MHAKSKSKISGMLTKSFKPEKCKTSLKLAVARIKLLKNKRAIQVKQMRRDVAQLLEAGQEQTARIRVEHVIREEKTMSAYELIEIYCELIAARLPIIESQKNCPIDLKEAIASVVFASPRCADIPELAEIQKHFLAKYGKEFITAALEVRPNCGVSRIVVEKLSAIAPDVETKSNTLTAIAQEHNVTWDSKAFEVQIQNPNDDLLNGPTTFISASKMNLESSNVNPSHAAIPNSNTTVKTSEDDAVSIAPSTSVPLASQSDSRAQESGYDAGEVRYMYSKEENTPSNSSNRKIQFKDATSAAQAAAESAERASMAARAAVELASRGNFQPSVGSHEAFTYGAREEGSNKLKGSKLEAFSGHVGEGSVTIDDDEQTTSHQMKPQMQNSRRKEVTQSTIKREAGNIYDGHASAENVLSRSPSNSSGSSINNDALNDDLDDLHKSGSNSFHVAQKSFLEEEYMVQNNKNMKNENAPFASGHVDEDYSKSTAYADTSVDDSIWADRENAALDESSAAVFDDFGSDTDDRSVFGRYSRENLLDSFLAQQTGEPPSTFSSHTGYWSPKQQTSGSLASDSSLHFVTKPNATNYLEMEPSPSNDNVPPTYDSDGLGSDSEDEIDKSRDIDSMRSSSLLQSQRSSTKGLSLEEYGHGALISNDEKGSDEANIYSGPLGSSNVAQKNHKVEPITSDDYVKRSGFSDLHNKQPSPRNNKDVRNADDTRRVSNFSLAEEEPRPWESPKDLSLEEAETEDIFGMPSLTSEIKDYEIPNESSESGQVLSYGRLTGGFRNKKYPRLPYVRTTLVDDSPPSKRTSDDIPSITERPTASSVDESSVGIEVPDDEKLYQDSKAYTSKSGSLTANSGPDFDRNQEPVTWDTLRGRGDRDEASLMSYNSVEDTPTIEKPVVSYHSKITEDSGSPVNESYSQRQNKETGFRSLVANIDQGSEGKQHYTVASRRHRDYRSTQSRQSPDELPSNERSAVSRQSRTWFSSEGKMHGKANNESNLQMPINYFDSDENEAEELQPYLTVGRRGSGDVKLSRRTKDTSSEGKKNTFSRTIDQSGEAAVSEMESKPYQTSFPTAEPFSSTRAHDRSLDGKGGSRFLQPKSAERPSATRQTESSIVKESPKSSQPVVEEKDENSKISSSTRGLTSREGSFKNASHVHPKLPDYDSLAAHFQSLKANRRAQ